MGREPSSRSLKSSETSSSEYDLARMRKELAAKIEKIVLLEFDLEMCKDELHELKQKQMRSDAFPAQQVEENPTDYQDEFFSDEEDEDEIW
jgi:hypothetical protein